MPRAVRAPEIAAEVTPISCPATPSAGLTLFSYINNGRGGSGAMAMEEHMDTDARRLTRHLRRYAEYLFTFLDYPCMTANNSFGYRQIRPAVIWRKNPDASGSNRSNRSAVTQTVLVSGCRTR